MLKRLSLIFMLIALSATLLAACGGKDDDDEEGEEAAPAKQAWSPKGNEGTISGVVKFDGTVPTPQKIDMSGDANCASAPGEKVVDDVTVADGKLANVYVYLKAASLDRYNYDIPDANVLDQHGCRYTPRVLGLMVGQTLRVTNSDPTAHNVHPSPRQNTEWNKSQPPNAPPIEAKFTRAETLIPVKCNQHPWMKAHIGVLAHPFFAVTDKDGKYTISGVPPGKYTLTAWHEKFGEQPMKDFEVKASESKAQDFTFGANKAYAPTSLTVAPAFIVPSR